MNDIKKWNELNGLWIFWCLNCGKYVIGCDHWKGKVKFKRIYPDDNGDIKYPEASYGKGNDGIWMLRPLGGNLGSLKDHEVTENEDGTITVSPSILMDDGRTKVHGYIERGIWRNI